MKKTAILILFVLMSASMANAQYYKSALGVRGGFYSGLSGKYFISETNALEGLVALHYRGLMIAGMYQLHTPAFDAPGLNWYYGGGLAIGFYSYAYSPWYNNRTGSFTTLGIMGVGGLEYKIEDIPITVGVDLTPTLNLIGYTGFWFSTGVTLRYVFE